jgi:hypothetical protein
MKCFLILDLGAKDCFVALLLAMTVYYPCFVSSGHTNQTSVSVIARPTKEGVAILISITKQGN